MVGPNHIGVKLVHTPWKGGVFIFYDFDLQYMAPFCSFTSLVSRKCNPD